MTNATQSWSTPKLYCSDYDTVLILAIVSGVLGLVLLVTLVCCLITCLVSCRHRRKKNRFQWVEPKTDIFESLAAKTYFSIDSTVYS